MPETLPRPHPALDPVQRPLYLVPSRVTLGTPCGLLARYRLCDVLKCLYPTLYLIPVAHDKPAQRSNERR